MPHAVFGIAARVSGGFCGAPCRARSRGPSWGVEVRIRSAVGLAALPQAVTAAVRPWPPPLPVRGRASGARAAAPAPAPRWRSRPPLPCRGGSRRGRVARGAAPRGCVPRRRPAGRRGVARRCALPPGLRPRRTACPEPALSRRAVWFSAGVSMVGGVPRRPPAPAGGRGGSARGACGTCGGEGRVCRAGGEKGRRSGATAALGPPPRPRPLPPPLPRPAPRRSPRFPASGGRREAARPAPRPCPTPVPPPPPPPSNPGRAPACAAGPCSRLPARRSAVSPACAPLPSPSPLPSRLSLPSRALSRSLALRPSLAEGLEERGLWVRCRGGGVVGLGGAARALCFGVLASLGVSARRNRAGLRSAASSRGRRSGPLVAPYRPGLAGLLLARARARPSETRPQIRRGDPLNLSILVSGGKETNEDSLSNGE